MDINKYIGDSKIVRMIGRYVESVIVPEYWEAHDGRGVNHLEDVLEAAVRLVGRKLDERELVVIALHDIGVGRCDRDKHGAKALEMLRDDPKLKFLNEVVDGEMAFAINNHMKEHYIMTGVKAGLHSLIVEADEGIPQVGVKRIMKPVVHYMDCRTKSLLGSDTAEVAKHIHDVLLKKVVSFSSGIPPFTERYCSIFKKEIEEASKWANAVTDDEIREVLVRAIKMRDLAGVPTIRPWDYK